MNPDQLELLITRLLTEHGPALRLYAATWANSPDDCVQQALIKLSTIEPKPNNMVAWLYKVVRNEAISQSRSHQRRKNRESIVARQKPLFEFSSNDSFDSETLQTALDDLEAENREVLVAKIWGGLTFEQIGQTIGCSTSAAHRRYQVALDEIKQLMASTLLSNEELQHEPK